jgi:pimeloyl-ACP methyl ester carboxylesterase
MEKKMKLQSIAVEVIAALTCVGGSWSCGGNDSSSGRGQPVELRGSSSPPLSRNASHEAEAEDGETCSPIGVTRTDYLLPIISDLPLRPPDRVSRAADLDIHRVSPLYANEECTRRTVARKAVILVHGASTDGVTTFDLRYTPGHPDRDDADSKPSEYSLMESLARKGVDTFAVNFLGYGLSSRFELDDACSANLADQKRLLVPHPLPAVCPAPPPSYHFTDTTASVAQLGAVVDHVLEAAGVEKVSFFAWSRGGNAVGVYTSADPSKVESLILLASEFALAGNVNAFYPLLAADRAQSFASWDIQLVKDPAGHDRDPEECPGERDDQISDVIWASVRNRDPLTLTWGPHPELPEGGVRRAPTATLFGWDPTAARRIAVPTLILSGLFDNQNPTARQENIYDNLGTTRKVLVKIDCATHNALWEGSDRKLTHWRGPHDTIRDAAVQWITRSATFQKEESGKFIASSTGIAPSP